MDVSQHDLHNGAIGFMLQIEESTMHRIFVGWVVLVNAILSHLHLKPDDGFLLCSMPRLHIKIGHGFTDIFIDFTGFKLW